MLIVFGIIIIIASIILGLIILIQNPKGGGLSSSFGGLGNQLMGVKQTTDVLGKRNLAFCSHHWSALPYVCDVHTKNKWKFPGQSNDKRCTRWSACPATQHGPSK